jgi:N-acetylmuramoyl-L-alanine amidase
MTAVRLRRASAPLAVVVVLLVACGTDATSVGPTAPASTTIATSQAPSTPSPAAVEPAPGSDSAVYAPNPGAIVVAIDAGHGGCLDWGVPDPSERGTDYAEKTMTLGIAQRLRDLLAGEGIGVVMIRDEDEALAGDDWPPLDCHGPPWRDVNGDGVAGFGSDLPEGTRTRDELQARLDVANLAGADALVSIHINSPTEGGQQVEIAFTETFYTDETPWGGSVAEPLATEIQSGVVAELDAVAGYDRGDRGITAHNLYIVAPPLFEPTEERPDPRRQPARGGLMPVVLTEVGSITLRGEHDLLVAEEGQSAVAAGIRDGLATFFGERQLAGRIGLADAAAGVPPAAVEGDGPPYWPPVAPDSPVEVRLTNTGTAPWPDGTQLVAGWGRTDQPYLARSPEELKPLDARVPALEPGESVVLSVELPEPAAASGGRSVAWITLADRDRTLGDLGSPPLQLGDRAP